MKKVFTSAFITGGSSGIGYAIAEECCKKGIKPVLIARNKENLQRSAETLTKNYPSSQVAIIPADISDRTAVRKALTEGIAEHGAPDLLVNCAGIAYPDYFASLPDDKFDQTIDINLKGTWNVLKGTVPSMKAGSWIVNVSSVAGFIGTFGYTAYSASKFGIIGLSEALRNELTLKGIGVSVLCPPDTNTPQLEQENRTKPPETRAISGGAKILEPEQVAAALFKGLKKERFMIIPGADSGMIHYVKRFLPGIVFASIDSTAGKVHRSKIK